MENSVIRKAVEGDLKAFKLLFDYYLPRMRPVCNRYCDSGMEVDDILQEAFIKIYYHLKSFKGEGSFEGWIRKTVVHTALNYYKKNKKSYSFLTIDELPDSELPDTSLEDIQHLEHDQLLKIIARLPEGYKMVFTMYVLDDFSHKEIGDMLGITEGSSRSQYSKAKKMINSLMARQRTEQKSSLISRIAQK